MKSRLKNWTIAELAIALAFVAFLALAVYALFFHQWGERGEMTPHERIAGAIFFGALCLSWSADRIADAIKDRSRSYNDTPESKAIRELAAAVDRLARRSN